jgi:twitching motility protein PilT
MNLHALLRRAVDLGASDVHLKVGRPPSVRLDGAIRALDEQPLSDDDLVGALREVTASAPQKFDQFEATGDLDLAYKAEGLPRFRVNAFRQRSAISFAFRVIPDEVPTFDKLGLPAGVRRLAEEHRGLVLVTGATGSGKSTTLAAIVDHINSTRQSHIVTIEDPIEILHGDKQSIVNQREVGLDTESFGQALRRALRQDPDTILIGELRDAETAQTALQAAESGHLVLSTMHTVDAAETLGRLIEFFPEAKQQQIRSITAGVLRGVISQRLLPRVGGGRVPAIEVMVTNARIGDLIRESRSEEITDAIADGDFFQMQTFQQALIALVMGGQVEDEVAANAAGNRHDFLIALEREQKLRTLSVSPPRELDPEPDTPVASPEAETGLRIGSQSGFTLIELLVTMVLSVIVIAGAVNMFVSGTRAGADANARVNSQQDVRLALDRLEFEGRCATTATLLSSGEGVYFSLPPQCTHASGDVSWCVSSGVLYRYAAATCAGATRQLFISGVATAAPFSLTTATGYLPRLNIGLTVGSGSKSSTLDDVITLRNGTAGT